MMLSVLICTLEKRSGMFKALLHILSDQSKGLDVEILWDDHPGATTGFKRQRLLDRARGDYVCFVDDDDMISDSYIKDILVALNEKPDVVGFKGWMLTNGRSKTEWIISNSLPYESALIKKKLIYLRHTNHLTPVKREIALKVGFQDRMYQEDYDFALRLKLSGLAKTEVFIDKHLYTYQYRTIK